jgi:hypothetical protein
LNLKPVTLFSRSVVELNDEPVTLLGGANFEPVTLSEEAAAGGLNGKRVVRQLWKARHSMFARSVIEVGADNW